MESKFLNIFKDEVGKVKKADPLLWIISKAILETSYDTEWVFYSRDLQMLIRHSRAGALSHYSWEHLNHIFEFGVYNEQTIGVRLSDRMCKKIMSTPGTLKGTRFGSNFYKVEDPTSQALILYLQGVLVGQGNLTHDYQGMWNDEPEEERVITRMIKKVEPRWPEEV